MATTRKTASKPSTKTKKTAKTGTKKTEVKKTVAKSLRRKQRQPKQLQRPPPKSRQPKNCSQNTCNQVGSQKPAKATSKTPTKTGASEKPAQKQPRRSANGFRINEFIVYPAHGVGQIIDIADQEIAGMSLELFVVNFEKEKMVLRVPLDKAKQVGMRKLADGEVMEGAMKTLRGARASNAPCGAVGRRNMKQKSIPAT